MKFMFSLVLVFVLCFGFSAHAGEQKIADHLKFLKTQVQDPVEYFVNLFDDHKIVVFCEGLHPELTQYEFLMKVVAHPKFSEQVRAVFTEIGSSCRQKKMDDFLSSKNFSVTPLLEINRENTFHPTGWSFANIILFWNQIWQVNSHLPSEKKIWIYPSDIPWDWSKILSKADYDAAWKSDNALHRDLVMAGIIADRIDGIEKNLPFDSNKKDKYLVVMNTRHAMGYALTQEGKFGENTCKFLKDKFGKSNVYNVLFHQQKAVTSDGKREYIREGKWDAAFYSNDQTPVGFNLAGSPFGNDSFDYHSRFQADKYSDVFDGLVFVKPLYKYRKRDTSPGFYSKEYLAQVDRRCQIAEMENFIQKLINQYGYDWVADEWPKIEEGIGISEEDYHKTIDQWLQ